jgi:Ca-activated chloride channel family protein
MLPDLANFEYFHFLRPWWALAFLSYGFLWLMFRRKSAESQAFDGIIAPHLLEHLKVRRFDTKWISPQSFTAVLLLLFIVIMMGPSWRQQPSPLSQDDSALVILLDVSASMSQRDTQPSRLARAKQKISDLLALRPDKQAALVVFSGSAHTVLSLTNDQQILEQYLAAIEPGIMPRPGKFPEYALAEADEILRQSTAPATLLLIGDGPGGDTSPAFEAYFETSQHQLLILGVGTDVQQKGLIPRETKALEQLASVSGGQFIALTIDDSDVSSIARGVARHFVVIDDDALPWLDSGYPLVFAALLLFLMWFRRGWTLSWTWLLAPIILLHPIEASHAQDTNNTAADPEAIEQATAQSGQLIAWFTDLWLTADQQGWLLMQRGHYADAANRFENLPWKALAYYYDEQFMLAAEYFSRSDSDDALFNEANARAQARDYVRARNRYDRLLARTPDYPGAADNRKTVQDIIDEINRLSESQQQEQGVSGEDKELGTDDAIPADGAEELSFEEAELVHLTAEEILQDPATSEMWLRGVQQDPSEFLAIKFNMQLQQRETAPEPLP